MDSETPGETISPIEVKQVSELDKSFQSLINDLGTLTGDDFKTKKNLPDYIQNLSPQSQALYRPVRSPDANDLSTDLRGFSLDDLRKDWKLAGERTTADSGTERLWLVPGRSDANGVKREHLWYEKISKDGNDKRLMRVEKPQIKK